MRLLCNFWGITKKLNTIKCSCRLIPVTSYNSITNKPFIFDNILFRKFCTKDPFTSKNYENKFAYNVIFKNGQTVIENSITTPVVKNILSKNVENIEELKLLVKDLQSKITSCIDSELLNLVEALPKWKDTEIFDLLLKTLDEEGGRRVPTSHPDILLTGALKMYEIGHHYKSVWIWNCLKRFCRRLDKLSSNNMLKVMFLVNLSRKFPVQYSGFDIQHNLVQHFETLTLDEMALVSIAFFKSQTRMNNKVIMSKILRKIIEEVDTCHSFSLAMLSKIIRYSLPVTLADELYVLQSKLVSQVSRLETLTVTHVALMGTGVLLCHHPLLETIVQRLGGEINSIRLKDMERMLLVMSLFDLRNEEFTEKVVKQMENREEEIKRFPKSFVCLVQYLTLLEKFEHKFIDTVLSKSFINGTYDRSFRKIGGELIYIDKSVEVEQPDYSGNRLTSAILKTSAKVMTYKGQAAVTGTQKFSYELENVLKSFYGADKVTYIALLPQYHFPDLLVGLNPQLRSVAPPQDWIVHHWGEVKYPPDKDNIWMVVVFGGWNTIVRNTGEPLGSMRAKLRQLKLIGYHPVLISFFEWRKATDKEDYLRKIIEPELKRISSTRSASRQ